MTLAIAALATFLGLAVGSFLNVVISRVPIGESVVTPASHCVACGGRIRARHNIPVISWFVLGGKCRDCGASFSIIHPLVEAGTALAFAAIGGWLSTDFTFLKLLIAVALAWLAASTIALSVIDLRHFILPNVVVAALYAAGGCLLTIASILGGGSERLIMAAVGLVGSVSALGLMALLSRGLMGLGDIKLAGALGFYLGWFGSGALFVGAVASFLFAALYGLFLIATRRANGKTPIAFGPWMLAGAWFGILFGNEIWASYIQFIYRALS